MWSTSDSKSTNGGTATNIIADIEADAKKMKYRHTMDKTYYIAKEILMTELTYKKDLDVINVVSVAKPSKGSFQRGWL